MASPDRLPPHISEFVNSYLSEMDSGNGQNSLPTGFGELDSLLGGGLQRRGMTVIFGIPGVGKTSFALNLALNIAATRAGVYFVSSEMPKEWIIRRALSILGPVNTNSLVIGHPTTRERENLTQAQKKLEQLPFYLDDTRGIDLESICSKAQALRKETDLDLIIIDRLELIRSPILDLRAFAQDTNTAVVGTAGSTLKFSPKSHHIENADTVIRLYQEALVLSEEEFIKQNPTVPYPKGIADLEIFKNRFGPLGKASILFFERWGTFENLCLSEVWKPRPSV